MEHITLLRRLIKNYIRCKNILASSLHLYNFQGFSSSCCSNKQGFYYVGFVPIMGWFFISFLLTLLAH